MESNATNNSDPSGSGDRRGANIVSSTMSCSEIIGLLTLHQCPDITGELHLDQCGKTPVFGGGFGDIYRGVLRGGQRVAIKCARLFPQQDDTEGRKVLKHTARELYTWSRLQHENVLQLFGLVQFREQVAMVSPWMDNGTLLAYVERNPDTDRYRLSIDICEGVAYLHENGVVHGDIKSANVLVSGEGLAKLADFGCTELKESKLYFTTTTKHVECSTRWAAPEILSGEGVRSKQADVYALGMTLLEIVTGMVPFSDVPNNMAVTFAVCFSRKFPERPKEFPSFERDEPDQLWELMVRTWAYSISDRPDSSAVKDQLKEMRKLVSEDINGAASCIEATWSEDSSGSHCTRIVLRHKDADILIDQVFFIVFPNIYCFNRHCVVFCVDHGDQYLQVDSLEANPPDSETIFCLESIPYRFDDHNQLWYNRPDSQWYPETTYSNLSSARAELARCAERNQLNRVQLYSPGPVAGGAHDHISILKRQLRAAPELGYAEFQFFVVDSDVYGYDYTMIVCKIDQQNGAIFPAKLSRPNPPTPNSIFVIGRASFKFDLGGILLRNITGDEWDPERTYVILADACQAATQGCYSWLPDSIIEPVSSLSNYVYSPGSFETPAASISSQGAQPYYPAPAADGGNSHKQTLWCQRAAPEWLLLGRVPSKEQVDDLVEAVKFERKNHETGGGPQLKCPLSSCGYNKELRRPQALRDHLYFHFGIKPYPCGRNGCDKTFQTKANRDRHFETCGR